MTHLWKKNSHEPSGKGQPVLGVYLFYMNQKSMAKLPKAASST